MKFVIACALALAYTLPCVLGQGRIYKGKNAGKGQFPYHARIKVFLETGSVGECGASLIATDWLLTAAHCVKRANATTVYLTNRRDLSASKIIIHENYNEYTGENDIALIQIPAVTLTKKRGIVQLPAMGADNSDYADQNVTVSGWGHLGNARPIPNELQWTTLKVISNSECEYKHMRFIRSGMLCATGAHYSSVCRADSGGPLVLTNTRTQVGIVSWGSRHGCQRGLPGVFTRITEYLQWIQDNSGIVLPIEK